MKSTTQPQNRGINIIALYLCFGKSENRGIMK
nr:MAG TPA: membrane protein complex protein [Caudoviricetes sp.]